MSSKLIAALKSVSWQDNVDSLCANTNACEMIEAANLRIAVWSKQLELVEKGNPALSFVREMQSAGHYVACLLALSLYRPAAASMRAMVECALYYTYFRTHQVELGTLVRVPKYYMSKSEIIEFHDLHTREFTARQGALNFCGDLAKWYSEASAIVHGQIPGAWGNGTAVSDISYDGGKLDVAVAHFSKAAQLVDALFLCTVASDLWRYFESPAKVFITKGMAGDKKIALKLDVA